MGIFMPEEGGHASHANTYDPINLASTWPPEPSMIPRRRPLVKILRLLDFINCHNQSRACHDFVVLTPQQKK